MEDQVEEIKRKTDIVGVVGTYVALKKLGRHHKGLCPFHSEKTPSFMVNEEMGLYKCFGCFPAGQYVKTPFGHHKIEDVVEGEYVISGNGEIKKVLVVHKRDYIGDLMMLKLSQLTEQVSLTGDHKVYVVGGAEMYRTRYKYLSKRLNIYEDSLPENERLEKIWKYFPIEKLEARKLKKGMSLLYPIDMNILDVAEIDLSEYITKTWPSHGTKPLIPPLRIKVDDNFLRLLGYYIAEGSNHRAYIRFSLGEHEIKFAADIVNLINKIFNIEAKIHRRSEEGNTGIEITACNSILANIFENLCGKGSENKHIPFIFQQLQFKKQLVLLRAIYRGDGHRIKIGESSKTERKSITTISRTLSEQLTDILLRLGFFPSRVVGGDHYDKNKVHHKESFVISWSIDPSKSKFHHKYITRNKAMYWILPILNIRKKEFEGKVHNLTIEDDHSYVANTFAVANCGEGGDVIKFLMEIEGIDFREALERLAEKAGVKLINRRRDDNDERTKMLEVMDLAARYYHWLLMEGNAGAAAREYLASRNINSKLMETFNIGFAMQSWEGLVNYLVKKKGYKEELLEKVGLVSRKSIGEGVYDKFRGRIMFPLQDTGGKVVGFTGRILPSLAKEDEPKYMNSPETPLYHKSRMLYGFYQAKKAIRDKKRVVLVEGQTDCISSYAAGITETVAVGGTALTEDQVEMLARLADKIYLSMDADEAGSVAIKRSVELAEKRGMSIKVVQIEGGKDPDEIARKSPDKWKEMVGNSVDVYEFVMNGAFKKYDVSKVEGIKKITEEVVPFLAKIENGVIREVWAKRLAEKIGVATKGVLGEIDKKISGKRDSDVASPEKEKDVEEKRIVKLARRLIGLLILRQEAVEAVSPWFVGVSISGAEGKLIAWLLENRESQPIEELVKKIPDELRDVAGESYMSEDSADIPGQKEVEEAAVQLLREIIRDRKKEYMEEMGRARQEKNEEREDEIFARLNELNKKESKVIAFLG